MDAPFTTARLRAAFLASVSVVALSVASPEVRAADVPAAPLYTKAPPPAAPLWTWYLEGGAFWTGGQPALGFSELRPKVGWEVAGGVDYRFAGTPWHASAQVRYGSNKKTVGLSTVGTFYGYSGGIIGNATHKESHLVADFAVGRDIGIGVGTAQAKLGVRVADLHANTNFTGIAFSGIYGYSVAVDFRSRFFGVGPRGSIEGSIPLGGAWALDYMGGVAVLYGNRSLDVSLSVTGGPSGTVTFSNYGTVFNADAMAGLSYRFSQSMKLTAGYRFDGYWNALTTFDSNFNLVNVDRFYHGAFLRATVQF